MRRSRGFVMVLAVGLGCALAPALGCSDDGKSNGSDRELPGSHQLTSADSGAPPSGTQSCSATGESCASRDCCAGSCAQGVCQAPGAAPSCAALGQSCSSKDCCSGVCQGSVCVAEATCVARGGDCSERDCCEGSSCSGQVCR